ncbi:hypothetical protein DDB_G0290431 [Dictyostelium discoideum AX4]|uniref:Uncharacterized protein n=1 Tax=Dictyostelium discoideum TaxID=44689 RepID=Q54G22_DICDI|nr:hypothetical protein DDB_G0290431 [Dictyostelium discoideum AX4]EAL62231.1 hypothetical protein DDB_G0290431 [Dictyostelium discoideum AX4]|eukprot:XP_635750.1 hypothetical protein DDB_G0290431 [Dictyostelium discoideum AX4]
MTSTNKYLNNNNNNFQMTLPQNSNNNINNNIITLNHFIFKDLSLFLANKSTFNEILEYALLSKKSFEIFRNILSYNGNICSIVFPFSSLKDYAFNNFYDLRKNNPSTYKFKLIQNKETQYLSLSITNKQQQKKQMNKIKSYLKLVFPNLKKVNIANKVKTHFHLNKFDNDDDDDDVVGGGALYQENEFEFFDDTYNGFFSYERVSIDWDIYRLPYSNNNEIKEAVSDLRGNMFYPFSFQGVEKLRPRKVYLSSYPKHCIHLYNVDSILNYSTIRSIKFQNTPSTPSFIKKALSLPNVKSLSLKLMSQDGNDLQEIDGDFVYNVFKDAALDENSTLRRLLFKSIYQSSEKGNHNDLEINKRNLMLFFTLLKSNCTLDTLGLEFFNIKYCKQLDPLLEIPNITTLYIHPNNIIPTLVHCLDNQNIQQLKFQIDDFDLDFDSDLHSNEVLTGFFKVNNTLNKIVVTKSSSSSSVKSKQFLKLLKKLIKNSKTSCKLIIKKVDLK